MVEDITKEEMRRVVMQLKYGQDGGVKGVVSTAVESGGEAALGSVCGSLRRWHRVPDDGSDPSAL